MGASHSVSLSSTLDPLPPALKRGLPAVAFFGLLSLATSTFLFLFLTVRLLQWWRKGQLRQGANQFFILIYNLLLADIQQATAFALTTVWVAKNKIEVDTSTCWANGWFVSVGDLASGVFIFSIALHTFFAVVKGRTMSDKAFYLWLSGCWAFVYVMAVITVSLHSTVYVRAGAWCWVDQRFENERLWLHYIWIFIGMFGTVIIYALIYLSINSRLTSSSSEDRAQIAATKCAAKWMIIYPIVYIVCTLPLAGGRMAAMTGVQVPYWYYCLAGAAITSCGWLDVLLYALTRRVLIFSKEPPPKSDYGLNTFSWWHGSDFYGTTTTVEGPLSHSKEFSRRRGGPRLGSSTFRTPGRRNSDEDHFATPPEGVITTKTTVEVTSGPLHGYAGSETSMLEMEDKSAMSPALSR
ncbi:hypothetical protein PMZ80_010350 [Knufia obscura]|uniref:G-protein coupled receptors family 1 profile domain-containing protein n=2 Tax=Knufia TaxID=430999 RepID=A0AAN8EQJ8_9EURO|nr:hypothetical protein PMZ80_010350 [Knufia obscura]KAK5951856.1 hypothetical protein OHC33_007149 [Knufia fluminis]